MNFGTVGGLAGGFIFVMVSCILAGSLKAFIDIPSLVVVLGGTLASVTVAFPISSMIDALKTFKSLMMKQDMGIKDRLEQFVKYAETSKKEGKLALEKIEIQDPFVKKGMDQVIGNTKADIVQQIMEQERDAAFELDMETQKVLDKAAELCPAWGMIGTLIGLVIMMLNLDDPSSIGPSMAIALITTFYGALFANLLFAPMAYKAETRAKENYVIRGIIIEGILSLAKEEGPRMMQDRLMAFVMHDAQFRKQLEKENLSNKGK